MNRVEQILNSNVTIKKLIEQSNFSCIGIPFSEALKAQEQTAIEFTKWKDDNYTHFNDGENSFYISKDDEEMTTPKPLDQLFNEWKNQTT